MPTWNEPGKFGCLKKLKANPDMPFFVLCASDPLAPKRVDDWAAAAFLHGVSPEKVEEAVECAKAMRRWQAHNGMKLPD